MFSNVRSKYILTCLLGWELAIIMFRINTFKFYIKSFYLFQLIGNAIIYICVNAVGFFIHYIAEHAQRKSFMETRNCISARLEMEDENEKLVSFFIFIQRLKMTPA